ncbi:MAG: hypothetical protein GX763_09775 [Clostridiaceae bacterium]|nr:hypothetical protein [Clostridiaceae bacterium]
MIFSKQSLYQLKLTNGVLSAIPNISKSDARITKIYKTKDPSLIDKSRNYLESSLKAKKFPDGIYKVILEYRDTAGSMLGKRKTVSYYIDIRSDQIFRQSSKYPRSISGSVKQLGEGFFRDNDFRLSDESWKKLINFYIIENPSVTPKNIYTTVRYFDIKENWGNNCWQKGNTLKMKLIDTIPNYKYSVMHVHTDKDMKRPLEVLNLLNLQILPKETIVCIYDSCGNIFLSIFKHIRNALAHGRYYLYKDNKTTYIFLEDTYRGKVTARMVFDISILLNWVDLIKYNHKSSVK